MEQKYKEVTRAKNDPTIKDEFREKAGLPLTNPDDDYRRGYEPGAYSRDNNIENEINRIKQEKAEIRLRKQKEEENLAELMKEVELKKERDLRARIEKEQIKKELVNLEKTKLTTLEQEKKIQLEKLANEREVLKQKEDRLMNELQRLEGDMQTMERIRQEDMARVNEAADHLKANKRENRIVGGALLQENSEKVAELKIRREQLDLERQRIMGDLDKIRKGEPVSKRPNYALYSANKMLGEINQLKQFGADHTRDILHREQDRIDQLKVSSLIIHLFIRENNRILLDGSIFILAMTLVI